MKDPVGLISSNFARAAKVGWLAVAENKIMAMCHKLKPDLVLSDPLCCTIAQHPLSIMIVYKL